MSPDPKTTVPSLPDTLPDEILEDVLCMTLKVRFESEGWTAASQVIPVMKPSTPMLQFVARRHTRFMDLDDHIEQHVWTTDHLLSVIQALAQYGLPPSESRFSTKSLVAQFLATAILYGHQRVLHWWILAASAAGDRHAPIMPDEMNLVDDLCDGLLHKWNNEAEDHALEALLWLRDHGHLPTLAQIEEFCGYHELFCQMSDSESLCAFFLEHYGATKDVLDEGVFLHAASDGHVGVLGRLIGQWPNECDTAESLHLVLYKAALAGQVEVFNWWVAHVRASPRWTFDLRLSLLLDNNWQLDVPEIDDACPELFFAYFLEQVHGTISQSLRSATRCGRGHPAVLDWLLASGFVGLLKPAKCQAHFQAILKECYLLPCLDWWLAAELPGLDKHIDYATFKECLSHHRPLQARWRSSGLRPQLPEVVTKAVLDDLFPSDQGGRVLFDSPLSLPTEA